MPAVSENMVLAVNDSDRIHIMSSCGLPEPDGHIVIATLWHM